MTTPTVTIDERFCGPPSSGNGGYSCGVAATALTDGPATVRLRRPPPLGSPMSVAPTAAGIDLIDDVGNVVASAQPWDGELDVPPAPTAAQVEAAVAAFDVASYAERHPFERCFTCGPGRLEGDGLRIFPAGIEGTGIVVWPWTPGPTMADDDGELVAVPVVWSALDCPSGQAWMNALHDPMPDPAVLGQFAVRVDRVPRVGESLVVGGWKVSREGRKLLAGSAVWTPDGELVACAAATWIVLDTTQHDEFGARLR